ncbi:NUDIX domain-containing protein [Nibricoccus sp. IMCC34717]|uniref:NUDIX domain-containing protein n=1 Tax=Nibricoccus sp. IMCC34717 TaxID=3034021 RepID=UPI00384BEFA3
MNISDKLLHGTRFLNLFRRETNGKSWIFASRKTNPLLDQNPDAVSIITTVNTASGKRLLVTREYRLPVACYEIAAPAGLIDREESPARAAARELKEETGLTLDTIHLVSACPTFSSAGLTDEQSVFVLGEATGELLPIGGIDGERIEPLLLSRADCQALLSDRNPGVSSKLWPILLSFAASGSFGPLTVD